MSATDQAPAQAATMDWLSPPFFVLRVGGLPVGSVAPLRSDPLVDWADRVLDLEHELARRKPAVGDALEGAIGRTDDVGLRRQLLAFRRDVFNLRAPRDRDAAARLAGGQAGELGQPAAQALTEWLTLQDRRTAELRRGEPLLADEVAVARDYLRGLADDPRLRAGIMLASPSLDRYLSGYTEAKGRSLSKRARRIERSLLEYVYRTACKTSPFSTFTTVALGRFAPVADGGLLSVGAGQSGPRSFTRLNLASVARLVEEMTNEPALRADLPVEVTSGWRSDAVRIRYVRRQRRAGDADAAVTMDILQENLFYLAEGGIVTELLRELPEGVQMRFSHLVEHLRRGDTARDADDLSAYLAHLLRLGLLTVPVLHVDIHHPDPLTSFSRQITGLGRAWADGLAERLGRAGRHVADFGPAGLADRRLLLTSLKDELTEAQQELGRAEPATPRTLLYEDVTMGDAPVTADPGAWERRLFPGLRGLCRILPAFDMTLPGRLLTAGFFRARHGAGGETDDVLTFAHEFNQDCYEQFLRTSMQRRPFGGPGNEFVPQENWFRLPEIDALDYARQLVVKQMRASYAALPPGAQELTLDEDFVATVGGALPEPAELEPRSFFLQVADDGTDQLAVVNRIYSGLTLLFSRFAHCFPDAGPEGLTAGLRRYLAGIQPAGCVFAELTGGYDTTNLNLHPQVTPYELVCPGDVSSRPPGEQIPVSDLVIAEDEESGRPVLRSRRLGVRVIPVYLGFLMPFALPEVQRVLLTFSCNSMAMVDLWGGVVGTPGDEVITRLPRIRLGNVILQRQHWRVSPALLPARQDGMTDADRFLSWRRWRRENGLPERVFVSSAEPSGEDRAGDVEGAPLTKPQHIDFGSHFSLTLLDSVLRSAAGGLVMTEMLPDLSQLWFRSGDDRYVTELTLELDGVKRSAM